MGTTFELVYAAVRAADSTSVNTIKPLSRKAFRATFIAFLLVVSVSSTCDRSPRWEIKGGNPPQFVVSGFGQLRSLIVYGPAGNRLTHEVEPNGLKYWEIRPADGHDLQMDGELSPISYGQVPAGFIQAYPQEGIPPQPLFEGGRFGFSLVVEGGDAVNALFTIHQNKVVVERH